MEPLTAVFVTGGIATVLFLVCIFNFARMGRNMFDMDRSFDDTTKSFGNGFAVHVISGGLASLAVLAFAGSFIWFLVTKFGA